MARRRLVRLDLHLALAGLMVGVAACASPSPSQTRLSVGYFPNLTHSQALIGLARDDFERASKESLSKTLHYKRYQRHQPLQRKP